MKGVTRQNSTRNRGYTPLLLKLLLVVCFAATAVFIQEGSRRVLLHGSDVLSDHGYPTDVRPSYDIVDDIAGGSSNAKFHQEVLPVATVAYVITLSGCTFKLKKVLFDLASVLKRSIEKNAYPQHAMARYAAEFFVILTPDNAKSACATLLQSAGFQLQVHDLPVVPEDIATPENATMLKDKIHQDGCCGHAELLKLHAYSMTNHSAAVHLDLDTLMLQPMEEIFDVMIYPPHTLNGKWARRSLQNMKAIAPTYDSSMSIMNQSFDAFYTKDYNQVMSGREDRIGVQGGMLVVRPNTTRRDELFDMVKSGQFYPGRGGSSDRSGWFHSGYGMHIWGAMTVQGLLAYYYDFVAHDTSVELHRCKYAQIVDNPRRTTFHHKIPRMTPLNPNASTHDTNCRDGRKDCEDVQCQTWPIVDTRIAHYTYCGKPWTCPRVSPRPYSKGDDTCKRLFSAWFDIRAELKGREVVVNSDSNSNDVHRGFCPDGQYTGIQREVA